MLRFWAPTRMAASRPYLAAHGLHRELGGGGWSRFVTSGPHDARDALTATAPT